MRTEVRGQFDLYKLLFMSRICVFVVLVGLICSCSQNHQGKSKELAKETDDIERWLEYSETGFALEFINAYVENCNLSKSRSEIVDWVNSSKLVTTNFKNGLSGIIEEADENDPDSGLDFDPFFDAQDYPKNGFEIESIDSISNLVYLKGKDWNDFKLTLRVKFINGEWFVDGCGVINMPEKTRSKR